MLTAVGLNNRETPALRYYRILMASDLTRVILMGGLGSVRFGMSLEEVVEIAGAPYEPDFFNYYLIHPDALPEKFTLHYRRRLPEDQFARRWSDPDYDVEGLFPHQIRFLDFHFRRVGGGARLVHIVSNSQTLRFLNSAICWADEDEVCATLNSVGVECLGAVPAEGGDMIAFSHNLLLFSYHKNVDKIKWSIRENGLDSINWELPRALG